MLERPHTLAAKTMKSSSLVGGRFSCSPYMVTSENPACSSIISIAYALHLGTDPEPAIEASLVHRYNDDVLILEPWEDIYTTDEERTMTFGQVLAFHRRVEEAYRIAGYTLIGVPTATLEERSVVVEKFIGRA